jgi:hypothetical protein
MMRSIVVILGLCGVLAGCGWTSLSAGNGAPSGAMVVGLQSKIHAIASSEGDKHPTSEVVVQTKENHALRVESGGDSQNINTRVYLVQLTGEFTGNFPTPSGAAEPTGDTLWFTLDTRSLGLMDISITNKPRTQRALSRLGTIVETKGAVPPS